jgi:hypothetical protein
MENSRNPKDANFNWVLARAECSIAAVFHKLKADVERDISTRNAASGNKANYEYELIDNGASFVVGLKGMLGARPEFIQFTLKTDLIRVTDESGSVLVEGGVTMNDAGECRMSIGGIEREFWQFRKAALERFFFCLFQKSELS